MGGGECVVMGQRGRLSGREKLERGSFMGLTEDLEVREKR